MGGHGHFFKNRNSAKACVKADLQQNVGTFLAFLCSSNWNEWYVSKRWSKGPGVEFKVCAVGYVNFHMNSKCNFPKHMSQHLLVQSTMNGEAKLQIFSKI